MKRLSNLLAALVFASLVIFMSCGGGGGDDTPPDVRVEIANGIVSGSWSNPTNITTEGGAADGVWTTFTLNFSGDVNGGSYTVSNVPQGFEDVWSNGTWSFGSSTDGKQITRVQNGVETPITLTFDPNSPNTLDLEFSVVESARTSNITGRWKFEF